MAFVIAALASQVQRMPVKPPVTIALMAGMVYLHLNPVWRALGTVQDVCIHAGAVLAGDNTALRLTLPTVLHGSDTHLYYNMISLLWKGAQAETSMGSHAFVTMVVFLSVVTAVLFVVLSVAGKELLGLPYTCAVGFR